MSSTVVRIDNVDPQIIYSGAWSTYDSTTGYNNTICLTRSVGNTATLHFVGSSVAAFGRLGKHPPNAPAITQYQVDDGDPTTFAPPSPSTDLTRLLFYRSPALSYGPHKLVMTNMMELDWIWFDYFEVTTILGQQPQPPTPRSSIIAPVSPNISTPGPGPTPSTSIPGGPVVSTTPTTSSNRHTIQSLVTTTPTALSTADKSQSFTPAPGIPIGAPTFIASSQGISSSNKSPTAAIVGGVLGGILFLTIIGTILLFCLRRRKRNVPHGNLPQHSVDNIFPPHSGYIATREGYSAKEWPILIQGDPDAEGDAATSSQAALSPPLSASTHTGSMYTPGLPVSKERLHLATIASPELPLPPYSVN